VRVAVSPAGGCLMASVSESKCQVLTERLEII